MKGLQSLSAGPYMDFVCAFESSWSSIDIVPIAMSISVLFHFFQWSLFHLRTLSTSSGSDFFFPAAPIFSNLRIFRLDIFLSYVYECVLVRVGLGVSAFVCAGVRLYFFTKVDYVNTLVCVCIFFVPPLLSAFMSACLRVQLPLCGAEMSGFWTGNFFSGRK